MHKAEITLALEYKAELQAAVIKKECGNLEAPIKALLAGLTSRIEGRAGGISVKYFCYVAEQHLKKIEPFKRKSGQALLPGTVPVKSRRRRA